MGTPVNRNRRRHTRRRFFDRRERLRIQTYFAIFLLLAGYTISVWAIMYYVPYIFNTP